MAALVVVDSGIVLATVLQEVPSEKAKALVATWTNRGVQLAAPTLFQYEVVAVIRKAVWQKRITPDEGLAAVEKVLNVPIQVHLDTALLKRAYEFAARFNRPTAYDSQYLALAERLSCEFWTADERLFNAVQTELAWVHWLGNFTKVST